MVYARNANTYTLRSQGSPAQPSPEASPDLPYQPSIITTLLLHHMTTFQLISSHPLAISLKLVEESGVSEWCHLHTSPSAISPS